MMPKSAGCYSLLTKPLRFVVPAVLSQRELWGVNTLGVANAFPGLAIELEPIWAA
jgi:hypothetical protein